MAQRGLTGVLVLAALAALLAGCSWRLPRAWRAALYGPDATATPRLVLLPTPTLKPAIGIPTPPPPPTPLPTLTPVPTRTATVTFTPTATPGLASLTLQEGAAWYIDEQFQPYDGTADTYISAWNRNGSFAGAASLSVRQGDIMAALIRFDLSDLPPSLPITRAEMSVYVSVRSNETPMTMTLNTLLKPWLSAEATWLQASSSLPWDAAGALSDSDRASEPTGAAAATAVGAWLTFDVTDLALAWLKDPDENYGAIISGEATNAVQYDLTSADARDQRHRPRLTLTFPTGALALGPARPPTPTVVATPTMDPFGSGEADIARLLPIGSAVLARAAGDLTDSAMPDIVAAYRTSAERGVSVAIFTRASTASDYRLLWNSQDMPGAAPIALDLADLTGDGAPEILLSVTDQAGNGQALYVYTRRPTGYRLALPAGGSFAGQDAFGDSGFDLADVNGDGRVDIIARRRTSAETYAWDGLTFSLVQ